MSCFEKSRPGHTVELSKRMANFTRSPRLIAQGSQTLHNLPLPWKHLDFGWPDEIAQMVAFAGSEFISTLISTPAIREIHFNGTPVFKKYMLLF